MLPHIQLLRAFVLSLFALLAGCACPCFRSHHKHNHPQTQPTTRPAVSFPHNFARWENEIAAYESFDRTNPPPKNAVLFIGSSTIRLWKTLESDFPQHKVINRGFGGSEIADATHFADRLILPHQPRQIFLRSGGNDINSGRLPDEVAADFADFVKTVHAQLPRTEIIFISLSPAPARWGQKDKNRELNRLVQEIALRTPRVSYVDTWNMTLTETDDARPELFVADMLHFNPEGYKLLADRVSPFLQNPPPTTR